MPKYIDADIFRQELKKSQLLCGDDVEERIAIGMIIDELDNQPAADVVEVVRCKDCRHRYEKNWAKCTGRKSDDFCSDGIRRIPKWSL